MIGILVRNQTRDAVLANDCRLADTFWARSRGLLFRPPLAEGEGLLITRCRAVHTFLMGFPIDVLFLDGEGRVARVVHALAPQRATLPVWRARDTLELPAGTARRTGTRAGDRLSFES